MKYAGAAIIKIRHAVDVHLFIFRRPGCSHRVDELESGRFILELKGAVPDSAAVVRDLQVNLHQQAGRKPGREYLERVDIQPRTAWKPQPSLAFRQASQIGPAVDHVYLLQLAVTFMDADRACIRPHVLVQLFQGLAQAACVSQRGLQANAGSTAMAKLVRKACAAVRSLFKTEQRRA